MPEPTTAPVFDRLARVIVLDRLARIEALITTIQVEVARSHLDIYTRLDDLQTRMTTLSDELVAFRSAVRADQEMLVAGVASEGGP